MILKQIFSIRNEEIHKIITILGIKIKFKSNELINRKQYNKTKKQLQSLNKKLVLLTKKNTQIINSINNIQSYQTDLEDKFEKFLTDSIDDKVKYFENILNTFDNKLNNYTQVINEKFEHNKMLNNEIMYANILRDCTVEAQWLKKRDWTLTLGAANYSFIFILFKILEEINPTNILEFGLGQTSKLTTQYVAFKNPQAKLNIVDHNQDWINIFTQKLDITDSIKINHKNLIKFYLNTVESDKYDSLDDITTGQKFDLIIIDGPFGYNRIYPRTNILDLIPQNLAENFVIILDDAERKGEQNTAELIFKKLKENNIEFKKSYKIGKKKQLVITSLNYEYIHWF